MEEVGRHREKLGSSWEGRPLGCVCGSPCGCPESTGISEFLSPKCLRWLSFGEVAGSELMDEGGHLGSWAGLCYLD